MKNSKFYFVTIICLLMCTAVPAFSQNELVLSVSPVRIEFEAESGQEWIGSVELTNKGGQLVSIETETADFTAEGEEGKPRIVPSEKHHLSMSQWVETSPARFSLEPGETKEIGLRIRVPENAPPGGHYAAVLFSSTTEDSATTAVVAKIGTLLLLRVPGEIVESGNALITVQRLVEGTPVVFNTLFTNEGNVHVKPKGTIRIKNIVGKSITELEAGNENVLPQSTRRFFIQWEEVPRIGIFTAQAEFVYGNTANLAATPQVVFFVVPWRLILGGLAIFTAGASFALLFRRKEEGGHNKNPV